MCVYTHTHNNITSYISAGSSPFPLVLFIHCLIPDQLARSQTQLPEFRKAWESTSHHSRGLAPSSAPLLFLNTLPGAFVPVRTLSINSS